MVVDVQLLLPHVLALHHCLLDTRTVSSSAKFRSSLLRMCIGAPESTTKSRPSGFFEEGAGMSHASVGEWNVALSLVLSLWTFFAKSHASLQASCCKASCPQNLADGVLEVHTFVLAMDPRLQNFLWCHVASETDCAI